MYFSKAYFDENNNPVEVEVICNKCGNNITNTADPNIFSVIESEYCVIKPSETIVCQCGNKSGDGIINYKVNQKIQTKTNNVSAIRSISNPKVECPYCHSINTTKITTTTKVVNTAIWGIFGTKRHKEWHCNACRSDF